MISGKIIRKKKWRTTVICLCLSNSCVKQWKHDTHKDYAQTFDRICLLVYCKIVRKKKTFGHSWPWSSFPGSRIYFVNRIKYRQLVSTLVGWLARQLPPSILPTLCGIFSHFSRCLTVGGRSGGRHYTLSVLVNFYLNCSLDLTAKKPINEVQRSSIPRWTPFHSSNSLWHIFAFFPLPHRRRQVWWKALHASSFNEFLSKLFIGYDNKETKLYYWSAFIRRPEGSTNQAIYLIHIVSTPEFQENWWNNNIFIKIVPSVFYFYLACKVEFFIYYIKICKQGGKLFRNSQASMLF